MNFVAPEIIKRKDYGKECDYWSIGILTYYLLCGDLPFDANEESTIFKNILKCDFDFKESVWNDIS